MKRKYTIKLKKHRTDNSLKLDNRTNKKFTKKVLIIYAIFLISILSIPNIGITRAEISDNYTQYLSNSELTISDDKAMILKEVADGSTNYRNIFESGFTIPAKLSNEMFNAYSSDLTSYHAGQVYFDNLDNKMNYMSNNNSQNIEQQIQSNNFVSNNGTNLGYTNNNDFYYTSVVPNSDLTTDWSRTPSSGNWYDKINDFNDPDYYLTEIYASTIEQSKSCIFGLTDFSEANLNISKIIVKFYYSNTGSWSNDLKFDIYDGLSWLGSQIFTMTYTDGVIYFGYVEFNNLNILYSYVNDFRLKITAPTTISSGVVYIQSTELDLYYNVGNYSYFESEIGGSGSGLFQAEYSFTDDSIGSNPTDWSVVEQSGCTVNVISDLNGHNKVVEMYDGSSSYICSMSNTISQTSGTVEFWIRGDSNSDYISFLIYDGSDTNSLWFALRETGQFSYFTGSYHDLGAWTSNTWYHIRIAFDCTTDWHLWINGISKDGGSGYSFYGTPTLMDTVHFNTAGSQSVACHFYIDAVDYSWSTGYYLNRNFNDLANYLEFESENNIVYLENELYHAIQYDLDIQIYSNVSGVQFDCYIYNYDLEYFNKILDINDNSEYSFNLNESAYFRFNKYRLLIHSNNHSCSFQTYLINCNLTIIYVLENTAGYQSFTLQLVEYNNANSYLGYFQLRLKIYQTYITYQYLEVSQGYSNYGGTWQIINTTALGIDLETLELLGQIRRGYNTLVQEITNVQFQMFINSDEYNVSILEQNRLGSFDGVKYRMQCNYSAQNRNYLNQTGIIGNYSYSVLTGIRSLKGEAGTIYNRFFEIPRFYEKIDLKPIQVKPDTQVIPDEPELPSKTYWTYETYKLTNGASIPISVGNWSYDFVPLNPQLTTAKYPYNEKSYKHSDWGSWGLSFKLGEYRVRISLNWLRDIWCDFVNAFFLLLQMAGFWIVFGFSYIFSFLWCYIVSLLYNIGFYYILLAITWVLWLGFELLVFTINGLIWLWQNLALPFLEWFFGTFFKLALTVFINWWALFITCLIWAATLGQIDFWETYNSVNAMLWTVADFLWDNTVLVITNLPTFLESLAIYLVLIGLCISKYLYTKSRGMTKRMESLWHTFMVLIFPFVLVYRLIKAIYDVIPGA